MTADNGTLLLVGSVARPEDGWTVEDVFRRCASTVGEYVTMLPDGELGDRNQWITYIARHAYYGNPALETVSRHTFDDWKAKDYNDQWRFVVREGVETVHFDKIGYAEEAKASYEVFRRLRDEGVIPAGVRFLVAYPGAESAVRAFFARARDFELVWAAYNEAVAREISDLAAHVPHEDLAIQLDLARETAAVERVEFNFSDAELATLPQDPMERYCSAVADIAAAVPSDVWLGLHVCYGSLGHKKGESSDSAHYVAIKDLAVGVDMCNRGARAAGRSVEFVHMPIQFARGEQDDHYAALHDLNVPGARVYLGLIDSSDGLDAAVRRYEVASRHLSSFGLATACGWGRRPLEEKVQDLLDLERGVAKAVTESAVEV
jgi:hypothetical protein